MIELKIDKKQVAELVDKLSALDPTKRGNAITRIFRAVVTEAELYMKENVLSGQTLKVRTGNLRRSIGSRIENNSVGIIGSGVRQGARMPYADIHETGGVIRAKAGKYLAIPLSAAQTKGRVARARPRDYDNTFVARSRSGNLIIFQRKLGSAAKALFVLKKSVTIPARPYMTRTAENIADRVMDIMSRSISRQLEGQTV
jgi:phage gpG-like protein